MSTGEEKTIKLYKNIGETPLERIERFRDENPEYGEMKLSYAGRLDPMAEGVMLILIGDENKEREKHLKYSKEYTFKVLFGFATDSYDLLGFLQGRYKDKKINEGELKKILKNFKGDIVQEYPPYSSKTVKGKPLYKYAQEGKLGTIKLPKHEITIFDIKLLNFKEITASDLRKYIIENVLKVKGDFRQKETLNKWGRQLDKLPSETFVLAKFNAYCSSGTYIRTIARDMGKKMGTKALAYSIKREDIVDK